MASYFKFMLTLVLFVFCSCTSIFPSFKIALQDEYGSGDQIVLTPGKYTKVNFVITTKQSKLSFLDDLAKINTYEMEIKDDNIQSIQKTYTLNPAKAMVYSTYIGIKCGKLTNVDTYTFEIKNLNTFIKAEVEKTTIKINHAVNKFEFEPISNKIPSGSIGYFQIKNELYNMEPININFKQEQGGADASVDLKIPAFNGYGQIYETDLQNNGFGVNAVYKSNYYYSEENQHKAVFEMTSSNSCYNIVSSGGNKLSLEFLDLSVEKLTEAHKEAIIYNTEVVTPKFGDSNSIEIETVIPTSPVEIICQASKEFNKFLSDNELTNYFGYYDDKSDSEKSNEYFSTFIPMDVTANSLQQKTKIKFEGLDATSDYFVKCYVKTAVKSNDMTGFSFTIGNDASADIKTELKPSRDATKVAQCAEFKFSSIGDLDKFSRYAVNECLETMTGKSSSIYARIMGCVKCEGIDKNKSNKTIKLCAAPSPFCLERLINKITKKTEEDNTNFSDKFSNYIKSISTGSGIKNVLGLENFEVESTKMVYDMNTPSADLIKLELTTDTKGKISNTLEFKVLSSHENSIQCYYNKNNLQHKNRRFLPISLLTDNVVLEPNVESKITFQILGGNQNSTYSLFMNCYNLPNFNYHYENSGTFTAYSYYYSDATKSIASLIKGYVPDCTKNYNKLLPQCLKGKVQNIIEHMKTKIPTVIQKIEDEVEQFKALAYEAQTVILQKVTTELDSAITAFKNSNINENFQKLVEKGLVVAEYLSKKDCLKLENYEECRNTKKEIQTKLVQLLTENFSCEKISAVLNKINSNIEEGFKSMLFLFNEITGSSDALVEGQSDKLIEINVCLREQFETYWPKIEKQLKEAGNTLNSTILAIKKDAINLITSSISNLVNSIHFDEIDGYIKNKTNDIKKSGLLIYDKSKKVYENILEITKKLNEFGTGFYNITKGLTVNVTLNAHYDFNKGTLSGNLNVDAGEAFNLTVSKYEDKGIVLMFYPEYMMKITNAYAIQVVAYDSPLAPVGENNTKVANNFVSINLYDKEGNVIKLNDMLEKYRPQILYAKDIYSNMKNCFYLDTSKYDLDKSGVEKVENFIYDTKEYIKCVSKHLTDFTAGSYDGYNDDSGNGKSGMKWWGVLMLILGCLILMAGCFLLFKYCNKKITSDDILEKEY